MSEENIEQVAQPEAPLETPAEVATGGSGHDFLSMIPEELREDPSLTSIKDVSNLARSYVNAQKLIGADKIPMPVNPTDEDLDRIYGKLGRPEDASGYGIEIDGNIVTEDVAAQFGDVAHSLRLNPHQAKGILEYYKSSMQQGVEASENVVAERREQAESSLRQEWGRAFDQKVEQAAKAAQDFAGEDVFNIQLADGSKLGNNTDFVKAFAKIAEFRQTVTSEDTVSEGAATGVMTPKAAQAEIDAIMRDKSHAYWDRKNGAGHDDAIRKMQELMGMVHG